MVTINNSQAIEQSTNDLAEHIRSKLGERLKERFDTMMAHPYQEFHTDP